MANKKILEEPFEKDVYSLISSCLNGDETICFDKHFDFLVPKGAKALKWGGNTFIEVKYRLMPYSFDKIRYLYDKINPNKLVVITYDRDILFNSNLMTQPFARKNIEFISYEELKKKIISLKQTKSKKGEDLESKYSKDKEKNNLDKAKEALKNDRVSLFLGAGVSIPVGSISWKNLIDKLLNKSNLTINLSSNKRNVSDLEKGRYIIDAYSEKKEKDYHDSFYRDMRDFLYEKINRKPKDIIDVISSLISKCRIDSVITYNYDDLIEQEINGHPEKYKMQCHPIYDKSGPITDDCLYIYHVHGYLSETTRHSEKIILGEKEYHKVYQDSYNWSNVEQLHALNRSTCFFIGLSMTDPNLRRLMDISFDGSDKDLVHYAFLCKPEHDVPLTERVMRDFGVNCIWYDQYDDLPKLLDSLI